MENGRNRLLNYLPAIFADDPFLAGFLRIMESIWSPLERQIDQLHAYFDPRLTPSDFLPWLGHWVDVVLDENWPEARQRELICRVADLYRRRGTLGGFRDYLGIYLGAAPEIVEDGTDDNPYHFSIIVRTPDASVINQDRLRQIIEEEKPAHTVYTLRVEGA